MNYEELKANLNKLCEEHGWLMIDRGQMIKIDGFWFYQNHFEMLQEQLKSYGDCVYWIYPSAVNKDRLEIRIKIKTVKD